jgi:plastocyanin
LKKIIALGALGAAIGVLVFASIAAAQSTQDQSSSDQASPEQTGPVQAAPVQDPVTVNIHDDAFDPAQVDIAPGTTVTWVNNDDEAHTVTADDGLFDSGRLEPGDSYSVWFDGSGTVAYHCEPHPHMTGSVVVGEASSSNGGEISGGGTPTGDSGSNPPNQATSVYP